MSSDPLSIRYRRVLRLYSVLKAASDYFNGDSATAYLRPQNPGRRARRGLANPSCQPGPPALSNFDHPYVG